MHICQKISHRVVMSLFWKNPIGSVLALFLAYINIDASACFHKKFNVATYGNDSEAISRLVEDVNKNRGGCLVFPEKTVYLLSVADDPSGGHNLLPQVSSILFNFKNCEYLDVDLNGSTIILDNNHSTKYSVFLFDNCKSFRLHNGTIVGDAKNHDYSPVVNKGKTETTTHEWGHGVMIMGSRGIVSDLVVSYMIGDGIYVSSRRKKESVVSAEVKISNCDISYCRRNGITCASNTGFHLLDTRIHEIGSYGGLQGTNPMAGIDFEYEDQLWQKGEVSIKECSFFNCEKKAISSSNSYPPSVKSLIVENCSFQGGSFQIVNLGADKEKSVKNCTFNETPINCGKTSFDRCKFVMGANLYYVNGSTFKQCTFEGTLNKVSGPYGCAIVGHSLEPAHFKSCFFRNIRGLNNTSQAYQGISGYNFPLVALFHNCIFQNTSFVKGNPKYESSFRFDGCTLTDGCMIYNEGGDAIFFVNSKLDNVGSYLTQTGEFSFDGCEIIQDNENVSNPLLYFGTHRIKKSKVRNTLSVTPQMKARGVNGVKYKE